MGRKSIIGATAAVAIVGLVGLGAVRAHAEGGCFLGHGGGAEHERIMRAIIDTKLDILAEKLDLTADQRTRIGAIKDGLIAEFKSHREERQTLHQELMATFKKDELSKGDLERLWAERQQHGQAMKDKVMDAIVAVHDILTPDQRVKLCDLMAEHFGRMHHLGGPMAD